MNSSRVRKLRLIAVAAALMFAAPFASSATKGPGSDVIGNWRFTAALDSIDIVSLNEREAKQLLGQVMMIRDTGTQFGDSKCDRPSFQTKRVEPNLYVQNEAGISASKLNLPNPVTVVDISCTDVLLRSRSRAVIFWKGWFFDAERIK